MWNKFRIVLVATLACVLVALPQTPTAEAETFNWSDRYPTNGIVTIPAGDTAVLDVDVDLDGLIINGTLRCSDEDRDIELASRYIVVSGSLVCGKFSARHTKNFTITLTGNGAGNIGGFGDKYLVVRSGGKLTLHGKHRTPWVRLTETAPAGATTLELENNNWSVGDRIVVASTDFRPEQAEWATIVAKSGNTVTLDEPLTYMHWCATETYDTKSIEECAEVGVLNRNITIQGDAASDSTRIGGHTMFHAGSRIRVQDVEFWRMGQLGRTGRYPAHFHQFGDATTSYFRNNSVWRSYNRWVTMHGVQNLRFTRNVGYDTLGHGFYMEDGDEIGNTIVRNLGIQALAGVPGQLVTPSDNEAAAFWFANPDNYVVGNVAAGATHSGFWYSLPERPLGARNQHMRPRETPLDRFHNNVAHSVGFAGLMVDRGERPDRTLETVWYNPREVPGDPNSPRVEPRFTNLTAYKSRHYGFWVRTFAGATFNKAKLADNWRSLYLANIRTRPSWDGDGSITNSLMVGETANVGQPESWETTGPSGRSLPKFWDANAALGGVPFYDGPLRVKGTVFANFQPNGQRDAGALTNLFPNEFWVSADNTAQSVTFVNAQRVLLPDAVEYTDGDMTTMFTDRDGSVTGVAGATVTVKDSTVDRGGRCVERPEWNAMQCDPTVGHMSVNIKRQDGGTTHLFLDRQDGLTRGFDGSPASSSDTFLMLVTGMRHEVRWADSVPTKWQLYVPDMSENTGNQPVRIALPAPSGNRVFQLNGQTDPAASLSDLNSGPSNWFYESATNLIHLRLVGPGTWATMN